MTLLLTGREGLGNLFSLSRVLQNEGVQVLWDNCIIGNDIYLAAAHLELGLTVGVLLDLNHY